MMCKRDGLLVSCGARTDAHEEEEDKEDVEDGHEGEAERRDDLLERPAALRVRFTAVVYSFHSRFGSVSQPFWIRFAAETTLLSDLPPASERAQRRRRDLGGGSVLFSATGEDRRAPRPASFSLRFTVARSLAMWIGQMAGRSVTAGADSSPDPSRRGAERV